MTITKNSPGIEIEVEASQDDVPVRGNALASGDDALDRLAEEEIIRRLDGGNVWAWANVLVTVKYKGILQTTESLGCCSYDDERDFRQSGGYFDDMVSTCIDEINAQLAELSDAIPTPIADPETTPVPAQSMASLVFGKDA